MSGKVAGVESDRPRLRVLEEDPQVLARAAQLLRDRSLPAHPLEITADGEDNQVVLAPAHVVRLRGAWAYDHRKEVPFATQARALGARVPACLGAGDDWSIWERLPGTNLWRAPHVAPGFWAGLCRDLARLHTMPAPVDAPTPNLSDWDVDIDRISNLPENEERALRRIVEHGVEVHRLTFAHGDVHSGNIIVNPDGAYGGLVDWADGGWWPPEQDYAILDSEGLRAAIDAPFEVLDWSLVAALRVGAYVRLTRAGFATLDDLREAIGFWELMR